MDDQVMVKIKIPRRLRDQVKPVLKRQGMTMTSSVYKYFEDLVEEHERVMAGRTQIDPRICKGAA